MSDADQLSAIFARCFGDAFGVHIEGGAAEPLYEPAQNGAPARLLYTLDHAASVLHEAAHWCLAGAARRRLPDFGLEYVPAAQRSIADQRAFERAEARTQAIEWRFALAADLSFNPSVDRIGHPAAGLEELVTLAVRQHLLRGWPPRVECFALALAAARGGIARPVLIDFIGAAAHV